MSFMYTKNNEVSDIRLTDILNIKPESWNLFIYIEEEKT